MWNGVNIADVPLKGLNSDIRADEDPEQWKNIHKEVIACACEVIKTKDNASWAIDLFVADLM